MCYYAHVDRRCIIRESPKKRWHMKDPKPGVGRKDTEREGLDDWKGQSRVGPEIEEEEISDPNMER